MSFNPETALNDFLKKLSQHPGLEPSYIEEIKNHFLDKVDHLIESGLSEEEAYKQANTTILSDIEELAIEYQKARVKKTTTKPNWAKDSGFLFLLPNYLKIAIRNLTRNTAFSFINISGLALGVACCLFILVFVQHELSFDKFHTKDDQIYRVVRYSPMGGNKGANLSSPVLPNLLRDFPAITNSVRMGRDDIVLNPNDKDNRFFESSFYWTDSTFFQLFDFNLIQGNPVMVLTPL